MGNTPQKCSQLFNQHLLQEKQPKFSELHQGIQPSYPIIEQLVFHSHHDFESMPFRSPYENMIEEKDQIMLQNVVDSRIKINNTYDYPFCSIGIILGKIGMNYFFGTGCLIAQNLVLTCAHNCYIRSDSKEAEEVLFRPAGNGQIGKNFKVKKIKVQIRKDEYKQSAYYDFAILELEENIEKNYGFAGIDLRLSNISTETKIKITSYPGDKKGEQTKTMWTAQGYPKQIYDDFIHYQIPTFQGQSGSPIIKGEGKNVCIVGIHIRGNTGIQRNVGIRLTEKMRVQINEWVSESRFSLKLSKKGIVNYHIGELLKQDWLRKLVKLDLSQNKITEEGMQKLSKGNFDRLQLLRLSWNEKICDQGILYLKKFQFLTELRIYSCGIRGKGVKVLAHFPHLKLLNLGGNTIGDEGMNLLIKIIEELPNLKELSLYKTKIKRQILKKIEKMKSSINYLALYEKELGQEEVNIVQKIEKKGIEVSFSWIL